MKKLAIIFVMFLFIACQGEQEKKNEVVPMLENQLKQTDSLFVILNKNPEDSILLLMDGTLERVRNVLADTMTAETETILEDYLELQSSLRDYKTGKDTLEKEVSYSIKQVENLTKDASEKSVSLDELENNASTEKAAIEMLQRNLKKMDQWFDSARETFITANELLNQKVMADSLMNVH